jgi:hypothetical protein
MLERIVKRYTAYFRGWCQTFGEHHSLADHDHEIYWLMTDRQAGFVLPPSRLRQLYREILLHDRAPALTFHGDRVEVGDFHFHLVPSHENDILGGIHSLLSADEDLHVYLTSHLMYGTKARIMTLSTRKPLTIIYKEIGDIRIRLS